MLTATVKASKHNLPVLIVGLVLIALWATMLWVGPRVERAYFPPITNVEILPVVAPDAGQQAFILSGDVPRSCDFIYLSMGAVGPDGTIQTDPTVYHPLVAPEGRLGMYVSVETGGDEPLAGEAVFHCSGTPWGVSRVSIKTPAGTAFRNWAADTAPIAVK